MDENLGEKEPGVTVHEKSDQVRHYEHELFMERIEALEKRDEERVRAQTEFIAQQSDFMYEMKNDMLNEMRLLERGIAQKTEIDAALMAKVQELAGRMDRQEVMNHEQAMALERVTTLVGRIDEEFKRDLKAAHDSIREHDDRFGAIEALKGRAAFAVLRYMGTAVGGVAVSLFTLWVTGVLRIPR